MTERPPIRILELRSVWGTGGGPDKTILLGTEQTDPRRFSIQVCYLREEHDPAFQIDERARGKVDYVEIRERHSFDPRIWTSLRKLVRTGGFDIVHAHDYKTDFLTWLLGRTEEVIPLATAHGWAGNSWKDRLYYAADRRLLARFPRVIAVSSPIRETLLRHGAEASRVQLVPNAIDPERFRRDPAKRAAARERFGVEDGTVAIGTVGRLESEKRLDVLLEACRHALESVPWLRLLIAGAGSLERFLRSQADRLGIGGKVSFLGHVDDVVGLHHALDGYVQASEREGTSNAVLEAMALETPIVATRVGGTEDLVRDGEHALLVAPYDPAALAEAIVRMVRDTASARRRVAAARQRVERELSFRARMRAVEGIYEELVQEHGKVRR